MQKQIAEWNTDLKLWGNWETDLLSERWEPFLETWPTSGTMRNGKVYELQTQERPTSDSESLSLPTPRASEPGSTSVGYGDSLNDFANRVVNGYARKDLQILPTPKARDHQAEGYEAGLRRASPQVGTILKGLVQGDERVTLLRSPKASEGQGGALGEAEARKRGNTVGVRDQVMDLVASQGYKVSREADNLLPTPIVRDYKDGQSEVLRDGKVQTDTVGRAIMNSGEIHLIGTPRATAANSSATEVEAGAPKARLEDQVLSITWGKFEPAIRRWEVVLGRPAPAPTKPDGKEGNHRLSSKFTEWMMGLPDNWITGHELKRNDELKLAGNGVVPQQAELALRLLLNSNEE